MSLLLFAPPLGMAESKGPATQTEAVRINLEQFGYTSPKRHYSSDKEAFKRPEDLLGDDHTRLVFGDGDVLGVYFTRPVGGTGASQQALQLEALFFNSESGGLLKRSTWTAARREWFNDSYDTQSRIFEIDHGLLVHAGSQFQTFSSDLKLLKTRELPGSTSTKMWSVTVAPGGKVIFLLPNEIDKPVSHNGMVYFPGGGEDTGTWLRTDSLETMGEQKFLGGPDSVSEHGIVERRRQCLEIQNRGEPPRNLCCADACGYGRPLFLSESEVLAVGRRGFRVLSTSGEELWHREADGKTRVDTEGFGRSMRGDRFAVSITATGRSTLDGVPIARYPAHTIFVYDRVSRKCVFHMTGTADSSEFAFRLSPDGKALAVLVNHVVSVYRIEGERSQKSGLPDGMLRTTDAF